MDEEKDALHVVLSHDEEEDINECPSCGLAFEHNEDIIPIWVGEPNGEPTTYIHEYCSKNSLGYTPPRIVLWDTRVPTIRGALAEALKDVDIESEDVVFVSLIAILLLFGLLGTVFGP